jgi:HemY protein
VGEWQQLHGEQPELLLVLAKLCNRAQLWGKAKDYFDRCLAQCSQPDTVLAYGQLLERLGEYEKALQIYREGLASLSK